jgi:hypothetical protein
MARRLNDRDGSHEKGRRALIYMITYAVGLVIVIGLVSKDLGLTIFTACGVALASAGAGYGYRWYSRSYRDSR